jgi:glutamate-1-semialdehyde 2,1-aminomutase
LCTAALFVALEDSPLMSELAVVGGLALLVLGGAKLHARFTLSRAKHRSLAGHPRIASMLSRLLPHYEYEGDEPFGSDGAPRDVAGRRREAFERLSHTLEDRAPRTNALSAEMEEHVSDVAFTGAYRMPFQYRRLVKNALPVGCFLEESRGVQVRDLDGNWSYDLTGAYGMNVFGYDFYKDCIERGIERVRELGPFLGAYHPVLADNVRRLKAISGLDEVSFHMSGTEAVMQAVRLARYHTRRAKAVRFCGAYHGWWDGVQAGPGNPIASRDVYTLRDMDERSLRVLSSRTDIACVLVNPLQSMHPNASAPADSSLVTGARSARFDRAAYSEWLARLRDVCTANGIVLILDEVFLGFRVAYGGAQEYFGVKADLVTYGKTLGGGLPIGVVCGRRELMKRFRDDRPSDVCFARGTFNSHPYVMATMNEFLRLLDEPELRASYDRLDEVWDERARALNAKLESEALPVRVANMTSIWTVLYEFPGRFHWMFQYYLRAQGLTLSWIGSGRLIFSHVYTDAEFEAVSERFIAAARAMQADGWWWRDASLTKKSIQRRVLRELFAATFRRRNVAMRSAHRDPDDARLRVPLAR